jgi:2'-5' RNA ligase
MAVGRDKLREQGIVDDAQQTGVMVAFYLPPTTANGLALTSDQVPEGSEVLAADDLHITLAYLGKVDDQIEPAESLFGPLSELAKRTLPLTGKINGIGRFSANEGHGMEALHANVDIPSLTEFRQNVVRAVTDAGFFVSEEHGFSPHVTLAYVPRQGQGAVDLDPPNMNVTLDTLSLAWGDRVIAYTLGSGVMNESRQIVDVFDRSLSEAAVKPDGAGYILSGVVIAEGLSANGNYYTEGALRSGIEVFRNKPIYADHPSLTEEQDRPERSVRDLVGRLSSNTGDFWLAKNDAGKRVLRFKNARLSKTADWLATMIEEGIAGDMSINAMGSGEEKDRTFHVTEFTEATSLDFVTQAAAGGLGQLMAAQRGGNALAGLTVRALASARPDLLDSIATRERRKAYGEKQQLVELRQAVEAITRQLVDVTARAEVAERNFRQQQAQSLVDQMLTNANLPPHSQGRVRKLIERQVAEFVTGGTSLVQETVSTASTGQTREAQMTPADWIREHYGALPATAREEFLGWLEERDEVVDAGYDRMDADRLAELYDMWSEEYVIEATQRRLKHERSRAQVRSELEALHAARPREDSKSLAGAVAVHLGVCDLEGATPDWLYQMARQVTREVAPAHQLKAATVRQRLQTEQGMDEEGIVQFTEFFALSPDEEIDGATFDSLWLEWIDYLNQFEARRRTREQGQVMSLAEYVEAKNLPPDRLAAFTAWLREKPFYHDRAQSYRRLTQEEWDAVYSEWPGSSQAAARPKHPRRRVYAHERV